MFREPVAPKLIDGLVITRYEGERSATTGTYHSFHGAGEAEFFDGTVYKGSFFCGQMHGAGSLTWNDGAVYEGEFRFNQMEGEGKLTWPDGSHYVGTFRNGLRDGAGSYINPSADLRYEGGFSASKRHGRGRLEEGNRAYYDGEWCDGKRHGHGKMQFPTGEIYEGEWVAGRPEGRGTMKWPRRHETYIGEWKAGKPDGHGHYFWEMKTDSDPAQAQGSAGGEEGEGLPDVATLPQAQMINHYDGMWSGGQRNGTGTFFYADGSRYHGEWESNTKHGRGVYTFCDGRVYHGEFLHDRMVGPEPEPENATHKFFGTIGVELDINDLVPGMGPKTRRILREVDHVLLRWNPQLRSLYLKVHQAITLPTGIAHETLTLGELFTIKTWQFWVMCRVCRITDAGLTLARIDRILAKVREVHGQQESKETDVHAAETPILFREFVEALVRIAFFKYAAAFPEVSLAMLVSRLFNSNLVLFERATIDELRGAADKLVQPNSKLSSVFSVCATRVESQASDLTVEVRSLVMRLQRAGLIGLGRLVALSAKVPPQSSSTDSTTSLGQAPSAPADEPPTSAPTTARSGKSDASKVSAKSAAKKQESEKVAPDPAAEKKPEPEQPPRPSSPTARLALTTATALDAVLAPLIEPQARLVASPAEVQDCSDQDLCSGVQATDRDMGSIAGVEFHHFEFSAIVSSLVQAISRIVLSTGPVPHALIHAEVLRAMTYPSDRTMAPFDPSLLDPQDAGTGSSEQADRDRDRSALGNQVQEEGDGMPSTSSAAHSQEGNLIAAPG